MQQSKLRFRTRLFTYVNYQDIKVSRAEFVPIGLVCSVLAEDSNGIIWDLVGETEVESN